MERQKTDWGEILWLHEKNEILSLQGLNVGIVSLQPGAHQPKHLHYEEQVIYVIQGQAISYMDSVESSLSAGDYFHWKAGGKHEIYNIGNIPFQHLLISNPGSSDFDQMFFGQEQGNEEGQDVSGLIYIAAEAVRTQFLETLPYAYVIFDEVGNLVLQSRYFPEYCEECCVPGDNPGNCSCMKHLGGALLQKEITFRCDNGMEVFNCPVYYRQHFLGYIQGGYVRYSSTVSEKVKNVYDVPESVIAGIKVLMRKIAKALRNYCEFEQFRKELLEKETRISSQEEAQRILMKNLKDTEYAMTDLKISNHFLFNTLNSMASMALDGGMMPLYQSIVDLSKMFHYTLRTQSAVVTLDKEMDYVKAYLQLQKLRYEDSLEINYQIEADSLKVEVPFNFLQPIVENAFIHGFTEAIHKRIEICIKSYQENVRIQIINSGKKLKKQSCFAINQGIVGNTAHGLSMIYHKLNAFYEGPCVFEIGADKKGDTCFFIEIPSGKIKAKRSRND